MALVDAYSPCPCGGGRKFKWCCQKAETYVDRAARLERNGQYEAALGVLSEAVAKLPELALPSIRKAALLAGMDRLDEARECLEELLKKQPDHAGALALRFRLLVEAGDATAAAAEVQNALARLETEPATSSRAADLAALAGLSLIRANRIPAGLRHIELAEALSAADSWINNSLDTARSNPSLSAWLKNPYALVPAPEAADAEVRRRFDEAIGWSAKGLWERAAAAFELLSADRAAGLAAERNLGLCRLWLGDDPAALSALRRVIAASPVSTDAVDLEALCQLIDPALGDDPIEEVELIWPLRDREGLLALLRNDRRFVEVPARGEDRPANETDFLLLDRPLVEGETDPKAADVPLMVGDVTIGPDAVTVTVRDDGRLDDVIDGFAAAAGQTIPPAHPRTKVIGSLARGEAVLRVDPMIPPSLPSDKRRRLAAELLARQIETRWPETPMVYLAGKSPLEAARSGGFEVPLRAALLLLEEVDLESPPTTDWAAFRNRLGVPAEPSLDPIDVDIDATHLGRLDRIDPKGLQDDQLVQLYEKGHDWGLVTVIGAAARELADRRRLLEREGFPLLEVFNDLAMREAAQGNRDAAMAWVARGREVTPAARRAEAAPTWDMLGVQIGMLLGQPEEWVPELVAVMGRYESNETATRLIMTTLARMGLLRLQADPDNPEQMTVDPTPLYNLIARYGPRVQTVGGGAAAGGGGIWTPGGSGGGAAAGGGIWTPGSGGAPAAESGAEKPRLILPGQ